MASRSIAYTAHSEWFATSGLPDAVPANAHGYAERLVRYISDPSTVRARTLDTYGRAPSTEIIRRLRERWLDMVAVRAASRDYGDDDDMDAEAVNDDDEDARIATAALADPDTDIVFEPEQAGPALRPPGVMLGYKDVIEACAARFGISADDITGECRKRHFVRPRQLAAAVLRARGNSYPVVGRYLGDRDHSTIIHAVPAFFETAARFPEYAEAWAALAPCIFKAVRTADEFELVTKVRR